MYIKHIVSASNFNTYRYSRAQWNDTFPGKKRGGKGGRKGGEKREGGEGKTLFSTIFVARCPCYCSGQ